MEVANHPDSTIVLDPFRIYRDGGEIEDMKGIPGEKIAVFHFNDALAEPARAEQSDADSMYPSDGILDLGQSISILKDANYTSAISLELFNPSYWEEDTAEVARIELEKMQTVLEA